MEAGPTERKKRRRYCRQQARQRTPIYGWCKQCRHKVVLPCLACALRARGKPRQAVFRFAESAPIEPGLDLRNEDLERYYAVKDAKDARAAGGDLSPLEFLDADPDPLAAFQLREDALSKPKEKKLTKGELVRRNVLWLAVRKAADKEVDREAVPAGAWKIDWTLRATVDGHPLGAESHSEVIVAEDAEKISSTAPRPEALFADLLYRLKISPLRLAQAIERTLACYADPDDWPEPPAELHEALKGMLERARCRGTKKVKGDVTASHSPPRLF